ncbi:MAG: hypothetical protein ACJAY5_001782, partial [Actinomycetes bacterium]
QPGAPPRESLSAQIASPKPTSSHSADHRGQRFSEYHSPPKFVTHPKHLKSPSRGVNHYFLPQISSLLSPLIHRHSRQFLPGSGVASGPHLRLVCSFPHQARAAALTTRLGLSFCLDASPLSPLPSFRRIDRRNQCAWPRARRVFLSYRHLQRLSVAFKRAERKCSTNGYSSDV